MRQADALHGGVGFQQLAGGAHRFGGLVAVDRQALVVQRALRGPAGVLVTAAFGAEDEIDALGVRFSGHIPGDESLLPGGDAHRLAGRAGQLQPLGLQGHPHVQALAGVVVHGCTQAGLVVDDEEARRLRAHQQRAGADDIGGGLADARIIRHGACFHAPGGQVVGQGHYHGSRAAGIRLHHSIPEGGVGEVLAHFDHAQVALTLAATAAGALALLDLVADVLIVFVDVLHQADGGPHAQVAA